MSQRKEQILAYSVSILNYNNIVIMKWISATILILSIVIQANGQTNKTINRMTSEHKLEVATLGSGCFWCVEAIFARLKGVEQVVSGYSGGTTENPTYKDVCTGLTGHVEVVQVTFNPEVLPFAKLLEVYFKTHDPTTLNRQGADVGTQYRSVIFYHSAQQQKIAKEVKELLDQSDIWSDPIVTAIEPFSNFYKAEEYHQDYFANNPKQPYCRMVVAPKVEKFEKLFNDYLKK